LIVQIVKINGGSKLKYLLRYNFSATDPPVLFLNSHHCGPMLPCHRVV
jgi:hypothetical protein